ncbi:2OG-Fe(II) oxygenase [Elioraea sp.]|uniref:2OG-Fe(II) oxygenase family protein n=1 Tax=Elioraea sp. TaxID=2185103 RepID=UPI0025C2D700|nr:2OG-Fe(II) oxygenase [Elioraea sp.]
MAGKPFPYTRGDSVPLFNAPCAGNPRFAFGSVAGRYVVLAFLGSAAQPPVAAALAALAPHERVFDDERACFFGVTVDADDVAAGRLADRPGLRFFDDHALAVSRLYGALGDDGVFQAFALLIDPGLRVLEAVPLSQLGTLAASIPALPEIGAHAGMEVHAPVLILPRVFEPEFCAALIAAWHGGERTASGFMREVDGRTVEIRDPGFKQRQDHTLEDQALMTGARERILRRVIPEIAKAFQFQVTRMERYLVARYAAGEGHFRAHRDNTTKGTAHRRFAVSINLCAENHEGGDLRFPEFGTRSYKPATGAAVVFGCGLLHEVLPVTKGERFAFLPFLYDDAAAAIRVENARFLGTG